LHAKLKNFFEKTKKFFWFFMQNCNDLCLSKKLNFILRISIKFYRICDWWQNVEKSKIWFFAKIKNIKTNFHIFKNFFTNWKS
jgi:hypothetical protein